jgi:hypothetical protein
VRLIPGSLPTVFNFPRHLQPKPVVLRKPPVLRQLGNTLMHSDEDYKTCQVNTGLIIKHDHCYATSPRKLKRQLCDLSEKFDENRQMLKAAQQKVRRLSNQLSSKLDVIAELEKSQFVSSNCLEVLKSCFSGVSLQLLMRQLAQKRASGIVSSDHSFGSELRAFALTLHFYSAKAYDYVRESFGLALPHPKTLYNGIVRLMAVQDFLNSLCVLYSHMR